MAMTEALELPPEIVLADACTGFRIPRECPWVRLENGPADRHPWFRAFCKRCDTGPQFGDLLSEHDRPTAFGMLTIVELRAQDFFVPSLWLRHVTVYVGQCQDCWSCYWYASNYAVDMLRRG